MSDHDIESNANGIKFTGSIELDWRELGEQFAGITSGEQAGFFDQFREALARLGHAGQVQLAFIGSSMQVHSARWDEVAQMLRDLAAFIDPTPEVEA